MPVLLIERGNDKGLSIKVEPGKSYLVGREHPQAAVKLTDPMASRAHFQISSVNGVFKVKDTKSRNGTMLNDEKLPPDVEKDLKVGDKIQVGETIFSFLSDQKEETTGGGLTGKSIGGYALLERVGRGGMGTVYKAEQISLKRQVALKVLSAKLLSDPVFVERFIEEARAAGGLIHPNIVQVIDVGSDRGIYYFSMEFMGNGSVGDIVAQQGPIPWERGLEMLTDATRGLVFAEKQGIVHRDIKPDNLMLTAEGTVKIGDLGLAKKTTELAGDTGQIFGTPHFIAPEQAQGKPVDNRADIYALGASFYRVLTGKTPFSGENVKEILVKQIQEEPRPLQELAPQVPDELALVLAKMMKKKPDDRYRSAQGLLDDLESIRVKYHLEAHGQATSLRRSKAMAAVFAVVAVALGIGMYYFATRVIAPPPPPPPVDTGPKETGGPVVVEPSPEQLAAIARSKVVNRQSTLVMELKGGPADTWEEHSKEWEVVAAGFQKVADQYPETPSGKEAAKEAKGIREALEAAKSAHDVRVKAANEAWMKLQADFETLLAEGKFAAAAALLQAQSDALLKKDAEFLPKDVEAIRKKLYDRAVSESQSRFFELLKELADSAALFPGEKYIAARKAVEAAAPGLLAEGKARPNPTTARLEEMHEGVLKDLKGTLASAAAAARAAVDADRDAYFRGYLAIRRWAPEGAGDDFRSPFFDYQWEKCRTLWTELLGKMRTDPYKARVQAKIAQYARFPRIFEMIATKIKARELMSPDFPDSVKRRTSVLVDGNRRDETTPQGLWILRATGGGTQRSFLEFREMTPLEIYEVFLKKGEGLSLSAEQHLDFAAFLAEAGQGFYIGPQDQPGHQAWAELSAAINSGTVDPALKDWIEREATMDIEWHAQVVAPWNEYLKRRGEAARQATIEAARKSVEDRIRALFAEERFYRTDLFILHSSEGGPEGPVPARLMPAKETEQVVRTLGVPDAVLPVVENTDPQPPQPPLEEPRKESGTPPKEPGGAAGPAGGDATKEKPK